MASNNFVISGKHTKTSFPLLESDPHLPTSLPSVWTLNQIRWGKGAHEYSMIGATVPGVPLIGIGRSEKISWGQTTPRPDTSDMWQETLNDDGTKYLVDGEWRDLQKLKSKIKVKGAADIDYEVNLTHRGPLVDS